MNLTAKRLRALLSYDPGTGLFRWCVRRQGIKRGDVAGCIQGHGYVYIKIDGRDYGAARLAWLCQTGERPPDGMQIDHRDGDRSNDRWENLRLATHAQNMHNQGRRRNNTSGFKGVHFKRSHHKYVALIRVNGKQRTLGYFRTAKLASLKYRLAARRLHGEFARTGDVPCL